MKIDTLEDLEIPIKMKLEMRLLQMQVIWYTRTKYFTLAQYNFDVFLHKYH